MRTQVEQSGQPEVTDGLLNNWHDRLVDYESFIDEVRRTLAESGCPYGNECAILEQIERRFPKGVTPYRKEMRAAS